jgi:hypothetical protein
MPPILEERTYLDSRSTSLVRHHSHSVLLAKVSLAAFCLKLPLVRMRVEPLSLLGARTLAALYS